MTAVVDVDDHPSVDHSSASNASTLIDLGVSDRWALGVWACGGLVDVTSAPNISTRTHVGEVDLRAKGARNPCKRAPTLVEDALNPVEDIVGAHRSLLDGASITIFSWGHSEVLKAARSPGVSWQNWMLTTVATE
jgi:hypothetical protein